MIIHMRKLGAVLIVAVLTAAGCGGSSGGGDSVSPPPPPPPPSGGIIRTGVGVGAGPITGFGSVIVNGVTYNTDSAVFTRDDNPSSQAEFKVGETVIVRGTIDDDNTNAVAETVELDELVKGPATQAAGSTAVVMGQTVISSGTTSVDDNCGAVTFDDLSGLTAFFAAEVYGTVRPDGSIDATRIECKVEADFVDDEFEVNGVVSMHDSAAMTFMINDLQVFYGLALSIDNFPGGQINDGDPVEAEGAPTDFDSDVDPDRLTASKVEYKGNRLDGNEGDHFEIEGFISAFRGVDDFDVRVGLDTFTVVTDPDVTVFEGDPNSLDVNVKVEVEGDLNGDLNIFATKVEIKTSTNIRVTGVVDPIMNGEIRVLNIRINTIDGTTRFEDKRDDDPNFNAGSLVEGDFIEARGQEIPAGEITAFVFEREDLDPDTELRGFVEEGSVVNRDEFVILGVTVDTSNVQPDDYFGDDNMPITADDFWTAVGTGGVIVDVTGTETGDTALQARELQLEME